MAKRNSDRRRSQADQKPQAKDPLGPGVSIVPSALRLLRGGDATAVSILLFVLVVWVFLPSVRNEFVNFDDPLYITGNPHVQAGLTLANLRWAFANLEAGFWHPLTWLSILLDCQLFGLRPAGHHLTSVLLHAANTVLLYRVFQRLTGAAWRSAFVAALFAVHPLHVESVAWAAERKDVLSTLFWMLAMLMYVHHAQQSAVRGQGAAFPLSSSLYFLLSLLFFVCGLMSKTMVITLPLVLLLLDWWPLRRFQPSTRNPRPATLFLEKLPFLAAALVAGLISIHAVKQVGALPTTTQFPMWERMANALLSYVRYPAQTLWPAGLAAYYPYPRTFPAAPVVGAALLIVAVSALVLWAARHRPYLAVGWLWYVVTLLPVIGLVQIGSHARADRYTYLPLIGLFVLLAWGVHDLTRRWRRQLPALSAAAAIICLFCAAATRRQLGFWRNSETLYRRALAVTQANDFAQYNLATTLIKEGRLDEAIPHLQEALRLVPDFLAAHKNLGAALCLKGRVDEAIPHLEYTVAHVPGDPDAHSNLGNAFAMKGRFDDAIPQYEQALAISPGIPEVRHNLGNTHFQLALAMATAGRIDEAIPHFQRAIDLAPDHTEAHCNLGVALARKGRLDEAIPQFREALRLNPDCADAQNNLRATLELKAAASPAPAPSIER